MQAKQRLYLTKDKKKLVPAGHKDADTLYCVPGDEIPESAVEMFGLVDGGLKAKPNTPATPEKAQGGKGGKDGRGGSNKEKAPAEDKEKAPAEDKEKAPAEDKGAE